MSASGKPLPWSHGLSVFVPCYNEQDNIRSVATACLAVLDRLVSDWELIFVDDGSTDATGRLADDLAAGDERIRVVHHQTNQGYGGALQSGFRAASKEYVFYTDGDGQFDLDQLDRLLPLADRYDIVSGCRVNRQDNFLRKLNSWAWATLVKRLLRFRCRDVDSAFKLYKREIFDHIEMKSTGALIDAEILGRAARAGYRLGEVRVSHLPRAAGRSTGAKVGVICRAFWELWRLRKDILSTPRAR